MLGSHDVVAGKASYIDVTVKSGTLDYDVTLYRFFDPEELSGASLPDLSLSGGRAWVGDDTAAFRSVYYLSATGRAVYVSSGAMGEVAAPLKALEADAIRVALSDPYVASGVNQ